jgi:hypothetical protein
MRRLGFLAIAAVAVVGCFSTIDRSKIAEGRSSPDPGAGDGPASDGGPDTAAPPTTTASGCAAAHDFCADFDTPGETAAAFGFESISSGERGTGDVTIESGGRSAPRCAHVKTPNDPVNAPGLNVGLLRSLDPMRGFDLAFDVMVQAPDWTGYGEDSNFKIALVSTANNTVTLSLHLFHPPAGGGPNQLGIVLVDPQDQVQHAEIPFSYGAWVHVDVAMAPTGVSVKLDGKRGFTRGAIAFDRPGRPKNEFTLGSVRDTAWAPATDVRLDNVVLDYR